MKKSFYLAAATMIAAAVGCYSGTALDTNPGPAASPATETEATEPEPTAPGDGGNAAIGLPCEVAEVMESCTGCHGSKPSGGASSPLVSYDDLTAATESDPKVNVIESSLARMKSTKRPMPPKGNLPSDQIAVIEKWIDDGLPRGRCGETSTDAGTSKDAGTTKKDAGPEIDASIPSVCTSGSFFTQGQPFNALMKPGRSCIACHNATGAKHFTIAGTVYPTIHEPNDCNGASGGNLNVVIIDAQGVSHNIPVNSAGNFIRITSIPLPYKAMVVRGTEVLEMKTPQFNGDCNSCHTERGDGAPGRVLAP